MAKILESGLPKHKKDMNILLLGKSGVGKSTFINSFANYIAYEKLEYVTRKDKIQCHIPSTFVLYNDEGEEKIFKLGDDINQDGNESMNHIKSGTRACKAYKFDFKDLCINMIDTPGMVDTAGPEQDKQNISIVLDFLTGYKSLHGICILLKPNENKLDAIFRYCILQILSQLDKSAADNIVFVFTHARQTLYKPGGSGSVIKHLLEEIKIRKPDVNIKFTKDNFFCLDSEAFQYLIARNEMEFSEMEETMFGQSWTRSREECVRMIKHISQLPEHSILDTISINESRRLISILSNPLADIVQNIRENQELCESHKEEIKNHLGTMEELLSKLYVPKRKLILEYFDYPKLFCGSENCRKEVTVDEGSAMHYEQVCYQITPEYAAHIGKYENEYLSMCLAAVTSLGISMNSKGRHFAVAAGLCLAAGAVVTYFVGSQITCPICNCSLKDHMVRFYETRVVTEEIIDEETRKEMCTTEKAELTAHRIVTQLGEKIQQLNKECDEITAATCKFAVFLKYRAITPYNDGFEDYLEYLIEVAKSTPGNKHERARRIQSLKTLQKKHHDEKKSLENSYAKSARGIEHITPEEITEIVKKLCILPLYGSQIQNAISKHTYAQIGQKKHLTVACNVSTLKGSGIMPTLESDVLDTVGLP